MGFFEKKKIFDPVNNYLKQQDQIIYANSIIDNNFIKNHPGYVNLELQRRTLKSQTPKWVSYAMLILTIIILGLTFYLAFFK